MRRTNRTLNISPTLIEASLMEGMFAKEMDSREIQCSPTCGATCSLKNSWLGTEFFDLLPLDFGFGPVAFDETPILPRYQ